MSQHHGILLIDASDWDREQVRSHLRTLSRPTRVLEVADLERTDANVDVIVLGFTDAVSLETARGHLAKARRRFPRAQLVLCAPPDLHGLDGKVLELKARAFLLKPVDRESFASLMEETLAQIALRRERQEYARGSRRGAHADQIVGQSPAIRSVLELIGRVAESTNTSVLLLGESGVGKSLFARTLHDLCDQSLGPFVEIHCAALPPQLLESELFGYEPGAFTDAKRQKIGLIELAHNGTLFLDEITEVELTTQAKLLKFLDSKKFRRLGGEREIQVDVRVVAATNRDLKEEVAKGAFREDLYYRLNVVEIQIPPLRERTEDIDAIARHYVDFFRKKFNKMHVDLSAGSWSLIRAYPWPGNVRELINVLERAVLLARGDAIEPGDLPIELPSGPRRSVASRRDGRLEIELPPGSVALDDIERAAIEEMLRRTRGNVSRAADLLAVSRGALRNKIAKYKIDARRFARPAHALEH